LKTLALTLLLAAAPLIALAQPPAAPPPTTAQKVKNTYHTSFPASQAPATQTASTAKD
jgi:hypothetical protein